MNRQPRDIGASFRVSDALWERIRPLLPGERPKPEGGRPRNDDRKMLDGSFYVLRTGIQWKALPRQIGAGSSVHDRLQEWQQASVFRQLWKADLLAYDCAQGIAWEWQAMDGAMTKAPLGGAGTGPNPTDRGKSGTKRSLLTDGCGVPLGVAVAGANRHDMKMVRATLETQVASVSATHGAGTAESIPGQRLRFRRGAARSWPSSVTYRTLGAGRRNASQATCPRLSGSALGRGTNPFLDESLSSAVDSLGKESRNYLAMLEFACVLNAFARRVNRKLALIEQANCWRLLLDHLPGRDRH